MDFDNTFIKRKEVLNRAYCDLLYLLDNDYPKKSALTFVSNHYRISNYERSIINRCVFSISDVKTIDEKKIIDPSYLKEKVLIVDLYNQYTSFQSILDSDPMLLGRDGLIRDIFSTLHSKKDLRFNTEMADKFLLSLFELKPRYIHLYIDQQRSKSKEHQKLFTRTLEQYEIPGSCTILKAVDHHLKSHTNSIILSHDSIVLKEVEFFFDFIHWYISERSIIWNKENKIITFDCK